jgi:hypothetical protein
MFVYVGISFGLGITALIAYAILQWLHIPVGNFVDWFIGIASFSWLLIIVTVPWNIYFDAREVIAEANISQEKKIPVDQKQLNYVSQVSKISIIVALALHILSALGLYLLSATGISPVGYISSIATLLLTFLRPAVRTYKYLATRLAMIRQQIKYPREDVIELRGKVTQLETDVKQLLKEMDLENADSLVYKQQQEWQTTRKNLANLKAQLEAFDAKNEVAHQHLSQEAKSAISQLTEDGQFLDHVREIIRFFKTA